MKKIEYELIKPRLMYRMRPLLYFFTFRQYDRALLIYDDIIVMINKNIMNNSDAPKKVKITIEWEDNGSPEEGVLS